VRRCVRSRNHVNEKALAPWGASAPKERKEKYKKHIGRPSKAPLRKWCGQFAQILHWFALRMNYIQNFGER
jgi:hypothetical protein